MWIKQFKGHSYSPHLKSLIFSYILLSYQPHPPVFFVVVVSFCPTIWKVRFKYQVTSILSIPSVHLPGIGTWKWVFLRLLSTLSCSVPSLWTWSAAEQLKKDSLRVIQPCSVSMDSDQGRVKPLSVGCYPCTQRQDLSGWGSNNSVYLTNRRLGERSFWGHKWPAVSHQILSTVSRSPKHRLLVEDEVTLQQPTTALWRQDQMPLKAATDSVAPGGSATQPVGVVSSLRYWTELCSWQAMSEAGG